MRRAGLRRVWRWLLLRIGRRGAFLGFLALLDGVLASSLVEPLPYNLTTRQVYGHFIDLAPIEVWATAWAMTGGLCLLGAGWKAARPAAFAFSALLKYTWSAVYIWSWLDKTMPNAYRPAAVWGTFAAVVLIVASWPEYYPDRLPTGHEAT